jgi:ABC-type transport system involved in cytochrome bd biosynthesis fused ATPase/permease subunit
VSRLKYNISDYKLKVIIDELGEEYKDLLIEQVLNDMNEIDADQINPSDLIRLDVTTKSNLRIDRKSQRLNRMSTLISLLGVIYALFGLMLMMWSELKDTIRYNNIMMISIVLIFLGLFVAIFSLLFKYMHRIRPHNYKNKRFTISSYEIINKWKEIEALINQLTPEKEQLSLSSMVSNLEETKIISKEDTIVINDLLRVRNQIVHNQNKDFNLPQNELRSIFIQIDEVISKMKKII